MASPAPKSPAARTILTLVRHGQTSANLDGVWHGWSDTPLTEHGQRQAERVACFLAGDGGGAGHSADATAVYSSPLRRARHTAQAIADRLGLELRLDDDLREYDIGSWEGKSFQELHEVHRLWHHIATDPDYAPHGGESPRQVTERLIRSLRRIAAAHPGERVIAVAHGGALSLALAALVEPDAGTFTRVMGNCAVSELALEPAPELLSFNLEAHLVDLE